MASSMLPVITLSAGMPRREQVDRATEAESPVSTRTSTERSDSARTAARALALGRSKKPKKPQSTRSPQSEDAVL